MGLPFTGNAVWSIRRSRRMLSSRANGTAADDPLRRSLGSSASDQAANATTCWAQCLPSLPQRKFPRHGFLPHPGRSCCSDRRKESSNRASSFCRRLTRESLRMSQRGENDFAACCMDFPITSPCADNQEELRRTQTTKASKLVVFLTAGRYNFMRCQRWRCTFPFVGSQDCGIDRSGWAGPQCRTFCTRPHLEPPIGKDRENE